MLMKLACYHRLSITRDNCSSFEELFVAGRRRLTREEDAIKRIFWETKKRNFFLRSRQTCLPSSLQNVKCSFPKFFLENSSHFSFYSIYSQCDCCGVEISKGGWEVWLQHVWRWVKPIQNWIVNATFWYKNFEYKKFEFQKFEFQKFENQGKLKIGATTNGSV